MCLSCFRLFRLWLHILAGKDPNPIGLKGFEAAMARILRETHSLPLLPRVCDDLLFGPAVDTDKQASFFTFVIDA